MFMVKENELQPGDVVVGRQGDLATITKIENNLITCAKGAGDLLGPVGIETMIPDNKVLVVFRDLTQW
jgi:hypothetical protein